MSFLPSLSPGNVKQRLPAAVKFDNDLRWTRPTEWLDLGITAAYGADTVPEKIKGLVAVYPNDEAPAHNYVALHLDTTNDSSYVVNWGDGTTETLSENTTHHHVYDYDAITSDTSTAKATPFKGYKQVIFEVTVTGSAKFSQISFDVDGPFTTVTSYYYRRGAPILDLFVSSSNCTNIEISDSRPLILCEQIEVRNTTSNRITTPQKLYAGAKSLQSIPFVPWIYNASHRDYLYAFAYCQSLKFLPDDFASQDKFWFKNCNRLQQTFDYCLDLQYLPEGLFGDSVQSSCYSFYLIFRDNRKLRYIPYLGMRTGSGSDTRVDYMYYNCLALESIPKGFSAQRMSSAGIDRIFYNCRGIKDWSTVFDGTSAWLQTINYNSNIDMTQSFGGWYNLLEFPFIGQFTNCSDAQSILSGNVHIQGFNSAYSHLDFTRAITLKTAFTSNYNMREVPDIYVGSLLTENNSLDSVFYNCRMLRSVKFFGMRAGPANGEYYRMFVNCYALTIIEGVDFSFATETSDYYQMFHVTRDINAIKFPGTFRADYPSPRINVTVNGNAALSGEYHLTMIFGDATSPASDFEWSQAGTANGGILQRSGNSSSGYVWNFVDTNDGDPDISSTAETTTEFTPHLATWPANTLTFSEVMTGFKYTVSGGSGDGLRYSPIKRTQMLEIFNQLHTVSYTATLDVRNNTYTADLTDADKAIATDKGWTLSLSY